MKSNLEQVNPNEIGKSIDETTSYLKKLSDYIETKLYDTEGNLKNGGVKSLSLTFAMLVGFSMAIVVVSSLFITLIIYNKSNDLNKVENEVVNLKKELKIEEKDSDYWKNRYNNVYSQCDSIGYVRASQALEFSNNINKELNIQKNKINNNVEQNSTELKQLNQFNKEIKNLQNKINK